MSNKIDPDSEEKYFQFMKRGLLAGGLVCVLIGVIRQWPIVGGSYLEFIEGDGYMSLVLGLVMALLGFSLPLLAGEKTEDPSKE